MREGPKMKRIPVAGPWITQTEIDAVTDAAATGWYEGAGAYTRRFEEAFAAHLGVQYAVSVPHCTAAIHLSLVALGVGPGAEVILPECTWIASAAPVSYVGATPIFADIDPVSWCLSAESFERCITPRTKAVIPVDLYGGMPDMDAIRDVAQRHGIAVIEDAAEAVGSVYKGRPAGSLGDTGVFSFHGSKTLTTGEGGLLATDREDIYRRVMVLRDHGRQPGDRMFFNTEVAFKYKMSDLQAALGWAQLGRLDELTARKRQIFRWYEERLSGSSGVALNAEPPGVTNSYWMVTAVFDSHLGLPKERVLAALSDHQIDARPFFHPLSSIPAYRDTPYAQEAARRNRVAYRVGPWGVNLPSALCLTEEQVATVCEVVTGLVREAARGSGAAR
jgi:perosamine synthetase